MIPGIRKIISGGQTGVDQGALDFAIEHNIEHGGYCPKGRICENGIISLKYRLTALKSAEYEVRTLENILTSDATLILMDNKEPFDGTSLTFEYCITCDRSFMQIDVNSASHKNFNLIINWIKKNNTEVLNIAGNRESQSPGIQIKTYNFLRKLYNYAH